jgi:DNA polymerase III delta subunit
VAEMQRPRVVWLSGNRAQRREILGKLKASLSQQQPAFEEIRFNPDQPLEHLEELVLAGDCFGSFRMIVVDAVPQGASKTSTTADLKKLAERVPADCLLVFSGLDPAEHKALMTHVGKIGKQWDFDEELSHDEAAKWLADSLAADSKVIDLKDALRLVQSLPSETGKTVHIDQVDLTASKLAAYLERRKNVTEDDVDAVLIADPHATVWDLFSAIDDKNFDRAITLLERLIDSEGNAAELCLRFLHTSQWRFRGLLFIKNSQIAKTAAADIVSQMTSLLKTSQKEGTGMSLTLAADGPAYTAGWVQSQVGGYGPGSVAKYTPRRLIKALRCLNESLEASRWASEVPQLKLLAEGFLLLACEKIDDSTRKTLSSYFSECSEI